MHETATGRVAARNGRDRDADITLRARPLVCVCEVAFLCSFSVSSACYLFLLVLFIHVLYIFSIFIFTKCFFASPIAVRAASVEAAMHHRCILCGASRLFSFLLCCSLAVFGLRFSFSRLCRYMNSHGLALLVALLLFFYMWKNIIFLRLRLKCVCAAATNHVTVLTNGAVLTDGWQMERKPKLYTVWNVAAMSSLVEGVCIRDNVVCARPAQCQWVEEICCARSGNRSERRRSQCARLWIACLAGRCVRFVRWLNGKSLHKFTRKFLHCCVPESAYIGASSCTYHFVAFVCWARDLWKSAFDIGCCRRCLMCAMRRRPNATWIRFRFKFVLVYCGVFIGWKIRERLLRLRAIAQFVEFPLRYTDDGMILCHTRIL